MKIGKEEKKCREDGMKGARKGIYVSPP